MAILQLFAIFLVAITVSPTCAADADGIYKIGVGIGDVTGPPAGVVLNGYVNPFVNAAGIFTRQYARAFVVQSIDTGNTVTYVTCDMGMMDHTIKSEVIARLGAKYGAEMFSEKNVMISATHTHSGVSGFMTFYAYLLIESYGFNPITYWATVDGITEAISSAADSLVDGRLSWNRGELLNSNGNRALDAYMNNPEAERNAYQHDVDKDMVLFKLTAVEGDEPIGAFTWWPVHPITFNGGDNPLVTSDSKGYAALLFDYEMNPGSLPGKGKFVSGFGSSNLGDVSTRYDEEEISPKWDFTNEIARCRFAGERQFNKAFELFNDDTNLNPISGPIRSIHTWVNTTTVKVTHINETSGEVRQNVGLCGAALGLAYLGLDPEQWELWEAIRDFIKVPSDEMIECQSPKLVALPGGEMNEPWPWAPDTFSLQLLQLGSFDVASLPGEFTTMAGRRVRNAIFNVTGHEVVLAGLANIYINYVTTPEEYDVQEYEGGATLYGRNTVPVTTAIYTEMAEALQNGDAYPPGVAPPSFLDNVRDTIASWADPNPMNGAWFGDLLIDVDDSREYVPGDEVDAVFAGGSPRNSPLRGGSFLSVEKRNDATGAWTIVRTDSDVDTLFYWNILQRRIELRWIIPTGVEAGTYRLRHFGYYRQAEDGPLNPYIGSSSPFRVASG
ncbi:neutral ceramidase [Folsomia candida]|uniref:neutral ceramidase n=1 Tax=Folsomia candida TaxID=158441 RepID=UPI000B8F602D|nr:neutral ceramidase [Folsomia candida]